MHGTPGSQSIPCPKCGSKNGHITDSRLNNIGKRRRRHCYDCDERFATIEIVVPDGQMHVAPTLGAPDAKGALRDAIARLNEELERVSV